LHDCSSRRRRCRTCTRQARATDSRPHTVADEGQIRASFASRLSTLSSLPVACSVRALLFEFVGVEQMAGVNAGGGEKLGGAR